MTTERELADLSDTLRPRVRALIDAAAGAGHRLGITSAWRSRAEQQRLYDGWKARKPGFNPANRPGTSLHENTGPNGEPAADACDLDYPDGRTARALAVAWVKANAHLFGLHLPIRREDWHVESNGHTYTPPEDIVASKQELIEVVRDEVNRLAGGPRRADRKDTDPRTISVADVLTAVEQLGKAQADTNARLARIETALGSGT